MTPQEMHATIQQIHSQQPGRYSAFMEYQSRNLPVPLGLLHPQAAQILRAFAGSYADTLTLQEQTAILQAVPPSVYHEE